MQLGPSLQTNLSTVTQAQLQTVFFVNAYPEFNQSSCFSLALRTNSPLPVAASLSALQLGLLARFDVRAADPHQLVEQDVEGERVGMQREWRAWWRCAIVC